MSDVSAIILTVGEETTSRAIKSIENQTLQPLETILVQNNTPFHNAMNIGINKVNTRFFVQVDSDFILDNNCIELLRNSMLPGVAITIGQLRDPITGIESGVKMYRTECFRNRKFKNTVSPETDIAHELIRDGWKVIYAINNTSYNTKINTLGEHNPTYTPSYTYLRFFRLGVKLAYRKEEFYIKNLYKKLSNSKHEHSLIAKIAFSNGLFGDKHDKYLTPQYLSCNYYDFNILEGFLNNDYRFITNGFDVSTINNLDPMSMFSTFMELGLWLRINHSVGGFKYYLNVIDGCKNDYSWVGKAGLCHGLLVKNQHNNINVKFDKISDLINRPNSSITNSLQ